MSEQLRKSELEATQQTIKFFETLLRASADGIVITDAAQNIVLVNEAFCAFLGQRWRDVIETNLYVWLEQLDDDGPRRWAELERRVRLEGACRDAEFRLTTEDGVRYLSVNCALLELVADEEAGVIISTWRDITERKRAEEALRESNRRLEETLTTLRDTQEQMIRQERLAAVGQLAAGIAHDFRNLLTTIILYANMALRQPDLPPKLAQNLETIISGNYSGYLPGS